MNNDWQSWLNWYSIGLENRHSERISGFESQALRFSSVSSVGRASPITSEGCDAVRRGTFNQKVESSSLLWGIDMHT